MWLPLRSFLWPSRIIKLSSFGASQVPLSRFFQQHIFAVKLLFIYYVYLSIAGNHFLTDQNCFSHIHLWHLTQGALHMLDLKPMEWKNKWINPGSRIDKANLDSNNKYIYTNLTIWLNFSVFWYSKIHFIFH